MMHSSVKQKPPCFATKSSISFSYAESILNLLTPSLLRCTGKDSPEIMPKLSKTWFQFYGPLTTLSPLKEYWPLHLPTIIQQKLTKLLLWCCGEMRLFLVWEGCAAVTSTSSQYFLLDGYFWAFLSALWKKVADTATTTTTPWGFNQI